MSTFGVEKTLFERNHMKQKSSMLSDPCCVELRQVVLNELSSVVLRVALVNFREAQLPDMNNGNNEIFPKELLCRL